MWGKSMPNIIWWWKFKRHKSKPVKPFIILCSAKIMYFSTWYISFFFFWGGVGGDEFVQPLHLKVIGKEHLKTFRWGAETTTGIEKALLKPTSDSLSSHNKDQLSNTKLTKWDLLPETNHGFCHKLFQCCLA